MIEIDPTEPGQAQRLDKDRQPNAASRLSAPASSGTKCIRIGNPERLQFIARMTGVSSPHKWFRERTAMLARRMMEPNVI